MRQQSFIARHEFAVGMVALVTVILVLLAGVWIVSNLVKSSNCSNKGQEYGLHTHYRWLGTICYIELPDGRSVDINSIRFTEFGKIIEE